MGKGVLLGDVGNTLPKLQASAEGVLGSSP